MNRPAITSERASATENDSRWAAVISRDPEADGTFYYSVATTGVYSPALLRRAPAAT
jgi:AraC family transcriptional regulator, regulatory protein of adaptative response / methylated-DNA-[protein]-cysteine methyltransferase